MPDALAIPSRPVARGPAGAAAPAAAPRCPFRALATNGVAIALLAGGVVTLFVLAGLGGLHYYATPLRVRGYDHAHRLLRPSGSVGELLGIAGSLFMLLTLPYVARKRVKVLAKLGSMKGWMEVHVFCGVFGPILVSLHTSFKFNGIVSVAYWSMVLVVLSGFVGRFLYARIPRTIRGEEMTRAEMAERAADLKRALYDTTLPVQHLARIEKFESETLAGSGLLRLAGDRLRARRLKAELRGRGLSREAIDETLRLAVARATLARRIAALERTRKLFALWHVFHRPLVWILFAIFVVHVAVVSYLGYALAMR